MTKLWRSEALRLSLICGGLIALAILLLSLVFYFGTAGVLARNVDNKITSAADRLTQSYAHGGTIHVGEKIEQYLSDDVDSDTEIYLLINTEGQKIAGNLSVLASFPKLDEVIDQKVVRNNRPSFSRMLSRRLPDGALLVVGRDMNDLNEINALIWRAIAGGGLLALLLSAVGTIFLRSRIERKILTIRHAAIEIETGNLSRRIVVSDDDDEFSRLSQDLNRMLDRIEHLMDGVRHVSNTIAHNLRTPLGRICAHLDEALRDDADEKKMRAAAQFAIEEINELTSLLNKVLQVAEAESGMRRRSFELVDLSEVIRDIAELYDAAAEEMDVKLITKVDGSPHLRGDRQLLASALANLLDNALKYAGHPTTITVNAMQRGRQLILQVADNGPGIPEQERKNVLQRFYRLDHQQQGNGMGLSIVAAIVHLHGGTLELADATPGLMVQMEFPII
ncbi:ATP-binding protein [Herbaspirillum sp. RTI4]|uniref:HAMP domain-containing sensor histidine kinase n=1 Tax=Herbaspirillum sp. RTI4 TaxID=3048640 RepID=UPI002AB44A30|nr:ATP-binding protein [Herbaspirillum sp. RTI4]MDY7578881.1 ATP-binding protein [Herbaspirillum sp. RTI4]MEA9981970.1 ATP-binding protein [Herbaspirillum sp. RTI4]